MKFILLALLLTFAFSALPTWGTDSITMTAAGVDPDTKEKVSKNETCELKMSVALPFTAGGVATTLLGIAFMYSTNGGLQPVADGDWALFCQYTVTESGATTVTANAFDEVPRCVGMIANMTVPAWKTSLSHGVKDGYTLSAANTLDFTVIFDYETMYAITFHKNTTRRSLANSTGGVEWANLKFGGNYFLTFTDGSTMNLGYGDFIALAPASAGQVSLDLQSCIDSVSKSYSSVLTTASAVLFGFSFF